PDSLPSYLNDLVFRFMEESVKEFDASSPFGSSSTFRYATGAFSGGSDHAEFTDSVVGVPCVMLLQWPDLFYHTSMDTIDKVSEDSLKRVGWIVTNATLTLANATSETAFQLASETASKGIVRIEEAKREAVGELFEKRQDPKLRDKPEELARELERTASHHRNRIEHFAWREQEAVKSVRRLGESPELNASLSEHCRNIVDIATRELTGLQETLSFIAKTSDLTIPSHPEHAEPDKEHRVVPKRLFKGTLDSSVLKKTLSEKELEWYEEVREKDEDFDKKLAEVLNFINGKRSVYEIAKAVSAEYSETNPENVLKFLRDLEKAKLVEIS
ncbi:MAG TPA: M28 family peptidase, partial [candidate division Zixibacteria bacterium]|nr:M28 family peptidase [candidate division Zixibacteria bacterium]